MSKSNRLVNRIKALFKYIPPSAPGSDAQTAERMPIPGRPIPGPAPRIKLGFSYNQGTVTALEEATPLRPEAGFSAPLTVSGTTIGGISAGRGAVRTGREIEIINGVAAMLSRHLEHLNRPERGEAEKSS